MTTLTCKSRVRVQAGAEQDATLRLVIGPKLLGTRNVLIGWETQTEGKVQCPIDIDVEVGHPDRHGISAEIVTSEHVFTGRLVMAPAVQASELCKGDAIRLHELTLEIQ